LVVTDATLAHGVQSSFVRSLSLLFVPIVLVGSMRIAWADDAATAEAREAYDRAAKAYDSKDYRSAAREFALADARAPNARALELALTSAQLANEPDLGMDLVIRAERRAVDGALAQLAQKLRTRFAFLVGRVRIVCPERRSCHASIEGRAIDDHEPTHVRRGVHTVDVSIDGGPRLTRSLDVPAGGEVVLDLASPTSAPIVERPIERPQPPEKAGISPVFFATSAGLAAVGLGTSLGLTVATKGKHDTFVASPSAAAADAGAEMQTAARVAWSVTGALVVVSVVVAVFTDFGSPKTGPVALGVGPGAVSLSGRF